ncbi:hypothetical protein TIFTF001_003079 [Ficus carica]|uniref:Uncharacterized protein n=1 Tax=Ficus carica TaxID=3494 RepID=A0AA87Z7L5_FICCA|nr:hypothetical protein TIFTF001_003079 [Ficus carica]
MFNSDPNIKKDGNWGSFGSRVLGFGYVMLQSEALWTTRLVNGSYSGRLEKLTMENGGCSFVVRSTKYKRRKVSVVRDFPAGCGRFAQQVSLRTTEDAGTASTNTLEDQSFKDASIDGVENGTSDMLSDLQQLSCQKYPPRRRVSAVREFPPFCGRNAPPPVKEESSEVLSSLKNTSSGQEKPERDMFEGTSTEAVKDDAKQTVGDAQGGDLFKSEWERNKSEVDVKQTLKDVPPKESPEVLATQKNKACVREKFSPEMNDKPSTDTVNSKLKQTFEDLLGGDSYKGELKSNGAIVIRDRFQPECEKNAIKDEHVILSQLKMDREEKENCNETAFEDKLYWWDHEFETVVGKDDKVEDSNENVGKEIDDEWDLKLAPNRVIVHGLIATSNRLWQEKFAFKCKPTSATGGSKEMKVDTVSPLKGQTTKITVRKKVDAGMSGSKEKKLDVISPVERQKTKITARKKVDLNIAKGKSLKKTPPETASQGTGQLVIWDKEDFLWHNEG